MTDLRTAAQQALEALECPGKARTADEQDVITALKAALAEFNPDWDRIEPLQENLREHMAEIQRLRAKLATGDNLSPTEPVAWVRALPDGRLDRLSVVAYDDEAEEMLQRSIAGCTLVPLYTAPPQRKPLTEEEIDAIPCTDGDESDWDALVRFARAIERAHGIGGNT